jgi:hypothetical protein
VDRQFTSYKADIDDDGYDGSDEEIFPCFNHSSSSLKIRGSIVLETLLAISSGMLLIFFAVIEKAISWVSREEGEMQSYLTTRVARPAMATEVESTNQRIPVSGTRLGEMHDERVDSSWYRDE